MYVQSGTARLARSNIFNCIANVSGGGLFSEDGQTILSDGTLISGCTAPDGEGRSLFLLAGEVAYALPASPGRWLPNARCEVYRGACAHPPGSPQQAACLKHRDDCATSHEPPYEWYCQNATFVQPCNWKSDPHLLGQSLYQLPLLPVEQDFPFACSAGILGSADPEYQSSSTCAGPCPPRRRCPTEATSQTLPCTAGHYCPAGTSVPLPCPAGSYSNRIDLAAASECREAEPGHFATTGSTAATPCSPGTFAGTKGQSECERCAPGTSSDEGSDSCDECEPGTYAKNHGQGECIPCPHPLSTEHGSVTCSICKEGYYLRDSNYSESGIFLAPSEHCKPCPPHAECPHNTTLETLRVPHGYWRASSLSAVLSECRNFGGDGETRCTGSKSGEGSSASGRRIQEDTAYCGPDFKGPECQLCVADKQYLADGDACEACVDIRTAAGRIAALGLGICVACGFVAWAYSMQGWRQKPYIGPPLRLADRTVHNFFEAGLVPKMKILLGFYQICFVLKPTYSARLPDKYTSWTDELAEAVSIDWSGFFLPAQCLPYWSRLVAVAVSPTSLIALLLLFGVGRRLYRGRARDGGVLPVGDTHRAFTLGVGEASIVRNEASVCGESSVLSVLSVSDVLHCPEVDKIVLSQTLVLSWNAKVALGLLDLTPACLVLVFCFVPSVSASIFKSWSCQAR